MENLKVNDLLYATLKDGQIIDGTIDKITDSEFWIDDNVSRNIIVLKFSDVETVHEIDGIKY